jgi:hypothetical protein
VAQTLAEASGTVPPAEAFVMALVHDIGKVVLTECSPAAMDAVDADVANGRPHLEAERHHFGLSHDNAGRRLAARWQLPHDLQGVIGDHHDVDPAHPPRTLEPRLGVIVFANALGHCADGDGDPERANLILHRAARSLGIPSAQLEPLVEQLQQEVEELAAHLGVGVGDLEAYASVINVDGSASVSPRRLTDAEIAERTSRQLELYRQVGHGLATGEDPAGLLAAILEGAVEILGFERVLLLRVDRDARLLKPWYWAGIGAEELAGKLELPLKRATGALALAVLERRTIHVPMARSDAYGGLVGEELLDLARCTGFAAAPVETPGGVIGVLYADGGPDGEDVVAEQATELAGLALQAGLVCGQAEAAPTP